MSYYVPRTPAAWRARARGLLAALWFMGAALLPVGLLVGLMDVEGGLAIEDSTDVVVLFILPLFSAALCGYFWGPAILDQTRVASGWRALSGGLRITLLAYMIYVVLLSVFLTLWSGSGLGVLPQTLVNSLYLMVLIPVQLPLLFVVMLLAGSAAGCLLYAFRPYLGRFLS